MGVIGKKLASRFRKAKRQLGDLRRQAAADFAQVPTTRHMTWQVVPRRQLRFHFPDRHSRFHSQTQLLDVSRRSRTPRGAFL